MKKTLAYSSIAVVLGVLVMLAPFLTVPTPATSFTGNTYEAPLSPQRALVDLENKAEASESAAGVIPNYPVDAISVSLVLLFSLAFALGVSLFLKKMRFSPKMNVNH
jgi:hypothetical protein